MARFDSIPSMNDYGVDIDSRSSFGLGYESDEQQERGILSQLAESDHETWGDRLLQEVMQDMTRACKDACARVDVEDLLDQKPRKFFEEPRVKRFTNATLATLDTVVTKVMKTCRKVQSVAEALQRCRRLEDELADAHKAHAMEIKEYNQQRNAFLTRLHDLEHKNFDLVDLPEELAQREAEIKALNWELEQLRGKRIGVPATSPAGLIVVDAPVPEMSPLRFSTSPNKPISLETRSCVW